MELVDPSTIQPGDILLYDHPGIVSILIKLKRGEKYSHVEIYEGNGKSLASRNGIGVGRYDLDTTYAAIYRSSSPLNFAKAEEWFTTVDGEGYDWVGLLSFTWAKFQGRNSNKMFCSEFVTRWYRFAGVDLFASDVDADAVSPGLITYSNKLHPVWIRADKRFHYVD